MLLDDQVNTCGGGIGDCAIDGILGLLLDIANGLGLALDVRSPSSPVI